jgi:cbb3-type cytochrome oxidase maturation protein
VSATLAQALLTLALLVIFVGFLIWGIKSGQFRDIEEPKYRIFNDGENKGEEKNKKDTKEDSQ